MSFFNLIEALSLTYFSYVAAYNFTLSAVGRISKPLRFTRHQKKASFAVLIPAYKEDSVIYSVAKEALQQQYPQELFEIIVIADSLQPATIQKLHKLPIRLVEVEFEKSTKVKALNKALAALPDDTHELALILDADNLMEPTLLEKVNAAYQAGYRSIQTQRTAKNLNTNFAILDALSEILNNHIYRRGTFAAGWSTSLTGSGMAFDFKLLKNTMAKMDSVGGFDRELEVLLLEQGVKSCYLQNALVFDEKVEKAEVFASQRKRWIASQFIYLRKYFKKGLKALFTGRFAFANSALLRNIQLPRVINLGTLIGLCILLIPLQHQLLFGIGIWWMILGLLTSAFVLAVPLRFYNKEFYRALSSIPQLFGIVFSLIFRLKGADTQFIHTPHSNARSLKEQLTTPEKPRKGGA